MKIIEQDEEGHHIMMKGFIHQQENMIKNVYTAHSRVPGYVKQISSHIIMEWAWRLTSQKTQEEESINVTYHWLDTIKAVVREKFVEISA